MVGIYKITCEKNNRIYIGSSKDIQKRWNRHLNDLKNKKHGNVHLQRSYDKHGIESFVFSIVESCEEDVLLIREQHCLDTLLPYNGGFNIGKNSSGGDNLTHNPNRDKIIEKIKKTLNNGILNMSEEERIEKCGKSMEKNPNWKGGISYIYSYCVCGNSKERESIVCSKCRVRTGDKNPFFNKKHTEETKKYLSDIRVGKYNGNRNNPIIINNIEYRTSGDASIVLGIGSMTIRWRVLSKSPKYSNYSYKGVDKISYTPEEQLERLSNPQKGSKHNHNKPFVINDIIYRTLLEASTILGIHPMTIKGRLKSKKFTNFIYC